MKDVAALMLVACALWYLFGIVTALVACLAFLAGMTYVAIR
jgi:hypothetical protein